MPHICSCSGTSPLGVMWHSLPSPILENACFSVSRLLSWSLHSQQPFSRFLQSRSTVALWGETMTQPTGSPGKPLLSSLVYPSEVT